MAFVRLVGVGCATFRVLGARHVLISSQAMDLSLFAIALVELVGFCSQNPTNFGDWLNLFFMLALAANCVQSKFPRLNALKKYAALSKM